MYRGRPTECPGAAKLPQALPHAANTNSRPTRTQVQLFFQGYAFARVFDLHNQAAVFFTNRYFCAIASGVTVNVGETLLNKPKDCDFHLVRESAELRWNLEVDFDVAAFREAVHIPAQSRCKAGDVKQRWVSQMRNGANLFADLLNEG